ncbi:hypothetical protein [Pseudomonas syringae]|uniref:hypothetical protein n=1 Tax=Pseudomonas syringae TaxID=317 RepID=UPI001F1FE8A1|nr:hypothetical protein [Pseudomonas syringae]MCF5374179.1 hypothetical protein [Pseudomonas syringae]
MTTSDIPKFDKEAYVEQLKAARLRVLDTKHNIVSWVSQLDVLAASEFIKVEPIIDLFPCLRGDSNYRLVLNIHTSPKRYAELGVALRTDSMRIDLSNLSRPQFIEAMSQPLGGEVAKTQAANFEQFRRFNKRLVGLKSFGTEFSTPTRSGPILPRWFEALHAYGQKCRRPVEAAFDEFVDLTDALNEAMFDFNATMGAVRYRSIRCSFALDDFDLLGPSKPSLKVVTSINAATRRRRYNSMSDFKKALKKTEMTKQLRRELGRDPEKSEVVAALQSLRPRQETDWITKDVIQACYLGGSINQVFEAQKNLVAVMQPWTALRAQLQALLP